MNIKYQVITKVSKDSSYSGFAWRKGRTLFVDDDPTMSLLDELIDKKKLMGDVRIIGPFHVGEIVIVDGDTGREFSYPQRAVSKWNVEYIEFDNIEKAVRKAKRVTNAHISNKL